MNFGFTTEQSELRDLVRGFLARHATIERGPGEFDRTLWRRLSAELGLAGLCVDEALGGAGAGAVEQAVVLEETGRVLLAVPYLSTVVAATVLPADLQGAVATGETIAAAAVDGASVTADGCRLTGVAHGVMDGDVADVVVVAAGDALFAARTVDAQVTPAASLDQSRPVARLEFDGTPAIRLDATPDHLRDTLRRALAVESLGVAAASLESVLVHLRTRHQFGMALANFQALRHRVADLAVALEAARSTTWYAVRADAGEQPIVAPMAKLVAADAAYAVTAESIQLHGGIGFTWEHAAHRYFKRATTTRLNHGRPAELRRLIGGRAGR